MYASTTYEWQVFIQASNTHTVMAKNAVILYYEMIIVIDIRDTYMRLFYVI